MLLVALSTWLLGIPFLVIGVGGASIFLRERKAERIRLAKMGAPIALARPSRRSCSFRRRQRAVGVTRCLSDHSARR